MQGKQEQADRIRSEILKQKTPNWQVIGGENLENLKQQALVENNKKAKMALFEYALVYEDRNLINQLIESDFRPAQNPEKGLQMLQQNHYIAYTFKKPDAVLKQVDLYGPDFRNVFNQTPLMVSAWTGNVEVVKALCELGADTEKVDGNGLNAFQIALGQSERDEAYAKKKLAEIYEQLEPSSMSIQVDGRLIKLDQHLMEFFLLNLMIALFYRVMPNKMHYRLEGFATQDILDAIQYIPNTILPERRKKRAYLSSILSKNEINRDDRYNRKLFYRVRTGHYIFNPNLALKVEGEWVNIYDSLLLDRLAPVFEHLHSDWAIQVDEIRAKNMEKCKAELRSLLAKMRGDAGGRQVKQSRLSKKAVFS